ncbi:MAG TPA: hypothetical protein VFP54_12160 [Acidimicrobiales bacterium]|nr:hypothetical protein [Acidimicrobiales bacterium]
MPAPGTSGPKQPEAWAQKPPTPLLVAAAQSTVSIEVYGPVPRCDDVAVPFDCTVQPAASAAPTALLADTLKYSTSGPA